VTIEWPDGYLDIFDDISDGSGGFTVWYGKEKYEGTYTVTATDGTNTATTTFTDSVTSVSITSPTATSPITITSLPAAITVSFTYVTSTTGATSAVADVLGTSASNGKNLTPGTGSDSIDVNIPGVTANGSYNVKVTVYNSTGGGSNQKNDVQNKAVVINVPSDTPPETSITSGPSGWINVTSATFAWTGSDTVTATGNLVYSYILDGGDWSAYSSGTTVTLTALSEGTHTFQVRAKDEAGNVDPSPDSRSFSVDTTAPTIAAITINDGDSYTNNRNVTLTLSAYDFFGVTGYCVTDDNGTSTVTVVNPAQVNFTATIPGTLSSAGDGTKTVAVRYLDAGGNWSVNYTDSIILDTTPPMVTVNFPPTPVSGWFTTSPVVGSVTATDSSSNVTEILVTGPDGTLSDVKDLGTPSASGTLTVSGDGSHMVICDATDSAGNTGTGQTMFGIDTTPPTLTKELNGTEGTNGWYTSDVVVTLTGGDTGGSGLASVEYNLNSSGWTAYTVPFTISTEGTNTLEHKATDNAGNVYVLTTQTIKIDKTPPVVAITAPANGAYYKSINVPAAGFTVNELNPYTTVEAGYSASEGVQTYTVTATDTAGNVGSASVTYTVDNTPPVVAITAPADGAVYLLNQNVSANWSATDALSGIASSSGTVPSGSPIPTGTAGANTFTVTATDKAGNTTTKTVNYYVRYNFIGFLPPVDNPPVFNVGKAGRTFPIKWQLKDANGNFISDLGVVLSLQYRKTADDSSAPQDQIPDTSGASGLRYDSTSNQFIFNWQTAKSFIGSYEFILKLNDGSVHNALFKFTK
jgi:large repetitive protein